MKRQALKISIKQLKNLIKDLSQQDKDFKKGLGIVENLDETKMWMISIINKTPEQSDTWELE